VRKVGARQCLHAALHRAHDARQDVELELSLHEVRIAGQRQEYPQSDVDGALGANAIAQPPEQQRARERDELHQQECLHYHVGGKAKLERIVGRHLLQGSDAVDVEPVRQQEVEHRAVAQHIAHRLPQLAPAGMPGGRGRLVHQPEHRQREYDPPQRDIDECDADRHGGAGEVKPGGELDHQHVECEQQAAAQIPEREAERGDAIGLPAFGHLHDQRVLERGAGKKADRSESEQDQRPGPVALTGERQCPGGQRPDHGPDGEPQFFLSAPVGQCAEPGRDQHHEKGSAAVGETQIER